jgi:hypothetical protein
MRSRRRREFRRFRRGLTHGGGRSAAQTASGLKDGLPPGMMMDMDESMGRDNGKRQKGMDDGAK